MSSKNKKTDDITLLQLKLEVAQELGLIEKVKKVGWAGLTAEETGKIGGYMTQKIKNLKKRKLD
ncbi:small, acid-soluble spore protein, alpha/beta type [Halothermothrix orenii]|uniref:Small acid-soluble spore protein n=1 Tax=Halothermothrix orenii (strain H 168 / OCM 544 / DSM 9562) TaxID=373903 RepID=B8CXS3_HALOH|nr:small, acid-soluble spore protein, alpha/beta type [Halothermothrix orenii]ACL70092.1 small acid-soluble spore protein [Halothermothrix orenii H 168]